MTTFINNPVGTVTGGQAKGKALCLKKHYTDGGGEEVCITGTLCGGEEIEPGTLHGGEEIEPGTLHGGEEIEPGTLHGGEEIGEGTLHFYSLIEGGTLCASFSLATYRTKDGSQYYKFRYIQIGDIFEIDIVEQPSYNGMDNGSAMTHRLPSARGGNKVCISPGYEPKTIEKSRKISAEWAEMTHVFINTGVSIDSQVRKIARTNKKNFKKLR